MTIPGTDVTVVREISIPSIEDASVLALVQHALDAEGATGEWSVTVVLTSDARVQALHRDFMGLDFPTDIMTFPYRQDDMPVVGAIADGGDIVISVEQAAINAEDVGWECRDEIEFLVCHGVLHLVGWEDGDSEQRDAMLYRQREILEAFHHGD